LAPGRAFPYVDWFETKPLGVYLFYYRSNWIGMTGVHAVTMIWMLLTALAVGWMAGSGLAVIFFALFTSFWDPTIVSTRIEVVLLKPAPEAPTLVPWFSLRALRCGGLSV
jgi:hypothetical protein